MTHFQATNLPSSLKMRVAEVIPGKIHMPTVFALCIVNFNDAVQGNVIWPLLPFAVQRWGFASDRVGLGVGILASSFFLAQSIAFPIWGWAGDRFGRRPCLIWGTLGTAISMLLFAFAQSFPVAMLARALTGILSGNVAISKGYMSEVSDGSTVARGFSWLSFTWGFGSIAAPSLGGYLSDPATQYPDVFGGIPFLVSHPYALPSLFSVGIALVSFLVGFCFLPETGAFIRARDARLKAKAAAAGSGSSEGDEIEMVGLVQRDPSSTTLDEEGAADHLRDDEDDAVVVQMNSQAEGAGTGLTANGHRSQHSDEKAATKSNVNTLPGKSIKRKEDVKPILSLKEDVVDTSVMAASKPSSASSTETDEDVEEGPLKAPRGNSSSSKSSSSNISAATEGDAPAGPDGLRAILTDRTVMTSIGLYAVLSFVQILFDELLSVFAETAVAEGGLGLKASEIGRILIFQGVSQIVSQMTFVPRLVTNTGPLLCFRHTIWPLAALIAFPALGRLATRPELLWPALAVCVAYKAVMMSISFTAISLAINNSSRGRSLGSVNGIAMSTASLVRAVGPTVGGGIYSASLGWGSSLGAWMLHVVYAIQAVFALIGWGCSFALPQWVNNAPDFAAAQQAATGHGEGGGPTATAAVAVDSPASAAPKKTTGRGTRPRPASAPAPSSGAAASKSAATGKVPRKGTTKKGGVSKGGFSGGPSEEQQRLVSAAGS